MKRYLSVLALSSVALLTQGIRADQPTSQPSEAITGTMDIEYGTRIQIDQSGSLKPNSPMLGAKDKYFTNITVNRTVNFAGEVDRQPNVYTSTLGRKKQNAQLYYNLVINVINPSNPAQHRSIGKWVGTVPIDPQSGAYALAGGSSQESPLRFDVDSVGSVQAFKDPFNGVLAGKAEKKESLAAYTFKRILPNGQTAQVVVKKSDPMRFDSIGLAKGPSNNYPRSTVSGRLDYDYETGNYYTDGIHIAYNENGKDVTDTVTGSIKWIEEPNRKTNGKGHYEFNLRWNEEQNKPKQGEEAAFAATKAEDAFFVVDSAVPSLTGTVDYVDQLDSAIKDSDGNPQPSHSKVTYHLSANSLSKQQVMSFAKLWLITIAPTNDE